MNDAEKANMGKHFIRMYDSLHQAVQNAGGSGASFSPKAIEAKSVIGLFGALACNGVRFYCANTHKLVELPKSTVSVSSSSGGSSDPRNQKDKRQPDLD